MTKLTTPNLKAARADAEALIKRFEIKASPVPVERIAKRLDVQVRYAPLDGELSGMAYIADGVRIVGVNALHHSNRQRFTLAHELGHICRHAEILADAVHLDHGSLRRDWLSAQGTDPYEQEANAFASSLLMPDALLEAAVAGRAIDFEDDEAIAVLARRFRVSQAAVRYRLMHHGF
jgi:Zn-dependent peptidase ImmA (M78 family)